MEEAAWCESFLETARKKLSSTGDFVVEVAPGRYIGCLGAGRSSWSMQTVSAARMALSEASGVLAEGGTIELRERAVSTVGPVYEEYVFAILPARQPAREIRITPKGVRKPRRGRWRR